MPFAAALSEHPDPAHAAGECVGQVLDTLGPHPDLALLFVTGPHRAVLHRLVRTVRTLLQPGCSVAAVSDAVIGGRREVQDVPAVSLWTASGLGEVRGVHLDPDVDAGVPEPTTAAAWRALDEAIAAVDGPATVVLLAEPASFPVQEWLAACTRRHPAITVIGGLLSVTGRLGAPVLAVDGATFERGAVAVVLGGAVVETVVSQGCRPVGDPFTVTRASGNVLDELGGRPALVRLEELAAKLDGAERELLSRGVHLGRVVDEHAAEHRRGDFLIRGVLGARTDRGALVVGDHVQVGDTVQFQVRDAGSAHEDLVELLAGHPAEAALVFSCNGRGRNLFDTDDHDAEAVSELTGAHAVSGLFCAGEVGPVGSRSYVHAFTASVALFRERSTSS